MGREYWEMVVNVLLVESLRIRIQEGDELMMNYSPDRFFDYVGIKGAVGVAAICLEGTFTRK